MEQENGKQLSLFGSGKEKVMRPWVPSVFWPSLPRGVLPKRVIHSISASDLEVVARIVRPRVVPIYVYFRADNLHQMDTVKSSQEGVDLNGTARSQDPLAEWADRLTQGISIKLIALQTQTWYR